MWHRVVVNGVYIATRADHVLAAEAWHDEKKSGKLWVMFGRNREGQEDRDFVNDGVWCLDVDCTRDRWVWAVVCRF